MAKKKAAPKKTGRKQKTKNSLVGNINKRKKKGTSRSKSKTTISQEAYDEMQQGWPKKKAKKKAKSS